MYLETNASKSWEMVRVLPTVARRTNISSARKRKVSCLRKNLYDSDARRTFYMYMRRGKEKLWTEHHSEGYNPKWLTFELLSYLLRALSQLIKVNFFSLLQKNSLQLIAEISASTYWTTGFYSLLRSSGILKSPIHSIIILFFIHNVL